jgi:hypothetical protein
VNEKRHRVVTESALAMKWHIVQLLLPLRDQAGHAFPRSLFQSVRHELTDRFGGLTAYSRAPAEGLWEADEQLTRDDIVVYEVMVPNLDRTWWASYRSQLEREFRQDELVVRAHEIERL